MARWSKGESGNPRGRPRGRPNNRTLAGADIARGLLDDEAYREAFLTAWRLRAVHPSLESLIWQLVHGRPRQSLAVELDASVRAAPFELRGPDGELLSLVAPGVGAFERADSSEAFTFTPAARPAGFLPRRRDDDDDS